MKFKLIILMGCILSVSLISAVSYGERRDRTYDVTVTNMTQGQTFTPILVVTHKRGVHLFTPGSPASRELAMLAEGGATGPLAERMLMNPQVGEVMTSGGLLGPGETATVKIAAGRGFDYVSLAAMLVPTNDGFIALNGVHAPLGHTAEMYLSPAYDAGSEMNDEQCEHIPGGAMCAGEGFNEEDGEGYVHIHAGIHGIGDIDAALYDWRNPVARIVIQKGYEY
ncbi:MAG TPA: hypothetical protein DDX85_00830 [Nitrospiraceae bacterium]|nr:hypothetical protein [Nitrospiraceae bacterium]